MSTRQVNAQVNSWKVGKTGQKQKFTLKSFYLSFVTDLVVKYYVHVVLEIKVLLNVPYQ